MTRRRSELDDPVALNIMWSRLVGITEECWLTIWRTAFSIIIGEVQDFACDILDAGGSSLAHSPRSMPAFSLTLPRAAREVLKLYPAQDYRDGDVFITNDPWICVGHLPDLAVISPVMREGKLVGFVGSIAHCSDIGGTRDSAHAREVYEEGLQIPPIRFLSAGVVNTDLMAMIRQNVRNPDMVLGDIHAQISANRVGIDRLLAFMDEYDLSDLSGLAEVVQGRAEAAMRAAVEAIPDGLYTNEVELSALGRPMRLPIQIRVEGSELYVDYDGAPPQVEQGAVNSTLSYTEAHSVYALKCLLTPDILSNAGCYRPFHVTAPEGSIMNCRFPAAVNIRTVSGWYCAPAIFGALASALPERVQAFTGLPMGAGAYGYERDGRRFNDSLLQGGGLGGGSNHDGHSAVLFPTSAANTSIEIYESRTPLLVECKELIADSGGPGRHRGGLGQRLRIRKLYDDGRPVLFSLTPHGIGVDMPGLFGGKAGRRGTVRLERGNTVVAVDDDVAGEPSVTSSAEYVVLELAGGSGYGLASERPLEQIQADFDRGLITKSGLTEYGCALNNDGRVSRQ